MQIAARDRWLFVKHAQGSTLGVDLYLLYTDGTV